MDKREAYPEEFVTALTEAGWLAALIPPEYGGAGLGISQAAVILEEIHRSGGNAGACHAQMYVMGTVLRHGSDEQKQAWLPGIAAGELRLQAFGVTEPDAGLDTTAIRTRARRDGDIYRIDGQKIWTSRVQSDLMLLLARTSEPEPERRWFGLSIFLVDLRQAGDAVKIVPIETMLNHNTNEVFIDGLEVPAENLIGEEGMGFRYILDGMNAERILIAAECVGDGRWFVEHGRGARQGTGGVQAPDRPEPGRGVPDRVGLRAHRGRRPDAPSGRRAARGGREVRGRGQHGEAARAPTPPGRPPTPASTPTAAWASPASTTWSASSARRASTRWPRSARTWCWRTWRRTCLVCRVRTERSGVYSINNGCTVLVFRGYTP